MSDAELSQETINEFRDQGVAVLRGMFCEWLEPLRAGVEKNLADPGPWVKHYTAAGGTGHYFGDYCNWSRIPEYRDFVLHSPVGAVGAKLMASKTVQFFHEHVFVKEPRYGQAHWLAPGSAVLQHRRQPELRPLDSARRGSERYLPAVHSGVSPLGMFVHPHPLLGQEHLQGQELESGKQRRARANARH